MTKHTLTHMTKTRGAANTGDRASSCVCLRS